MNKAFCSENKPQRDIRPWLLSTAACNVSRHGLPRDLGIVLGYGSAGANAALQAARLGARVLIIEKAERGGGNSFVSSANMTVPIDFDRKEKSDGAAFTHYLQEDSR